MDLLPNLNNLELNDLELYFKEPLPNSHQLKPYLG
jgi:hypothetical protein